jgi:putative ABC transport system substrate-binding protein
MKSVSNQPSAISKRVAICAVLFALCASASAQQPANVPRIGLLGGASAAANARRVEAFRQGLRELGRVEGKNIVIEERWAEGKLDRLSALAAELLRLKAEIILSAGPTVTRALKEARVTIPIVMSFDDDPVGSGFVASLARPGGNIIINLKAAKQIGLTIPPNVLARADRVIK